MFCSVGNQVEEWSFQFPDWPPEAAAAAAAAVVDARMIERCRRSLNGFQAAAAWQASIDTDSKQTVKAGSGPPASKRRDHREHAKLWGTDKVAGMETMPCDAGRATIYMPSLPVLPLTLAQVCTVC